MENSGYSLADIAALAKNGNGEGGWAWLFLIIVLLAVGGRGFGAGASAAGPAVPPNVATQTDVQTAVNNQAVNSGIQQVLLSSANNNYETAQLISGQTEAMMQMNNANQINVIQGFNNISNQITNQTNQLGSKLDQLGYQMDQCCCSIKTTLLQQQLDEANRKLADAQNKNNIADQTSTLLRSMGRFVMWEGSGTNGTAAAASA